MDCTEIRPLISYYYDGEATPEEAARVERHLAGCEDCRRLLSEYRAIGGGLRDMALPAPPAGLRRDVWRAIEAQQAGAGRAIAAPQPRTSKRNQGKVVQFPQTRNKPALAGVFSGFESGWSKALTAALVIGALFIALGVLIVLQKANTVAATSLVDPPPYSDYGQVVHVLFSKTVSSGDNVTNNVYVYRLQASSNITSQVQVDKAFTVTATGGILSIAPKPTWDAGTKYEIVIDAQRISRGGVTTPYDDKPEVLDFETVAYTPTPTDTPLPTDTPKPTDTPLPPTQQPTAVAQNTAVPTPGAPGIEQSATPVVPASATPEPPRSTDTSTPRPPSPTSTQVPPTATHVPPSATPIPPSATPTTLPTTMPIATNTPRNGTPTPRDTVTPRPSTSTPTPALPCNIMPVNGFGKVWSEHSNIRDRVGCPIEHETALQSAAAETFQGGYMFWRGDTKTIYVFFWGSANDTVGAWQQYPDTWNDGDPEPTPDQTPPAGLYTPVRGFGKLWRENSSLRDALGYAVEPEQAITGAWQAYQHGFALWTDDKVIRFMFTDSNIWMRFADTFVMPSATPTP